MQRSICIVGGRGNMGRRYQAICEFLGIPYHISDVDDELVDTSHYLIATPTEKHADNIFEILATQKPGKLVLCEKPIALASPHRWPNLETALRRFNEKHPLYMVNQYSFYPGINAKGMVTLYDYYNSGPHGLEWDCIQLTHLAQSEVKYLKKSPIWKCIINGMPLSRDRLDQCYVEMVRSFFKEDTAKLWGIEDVVASHRKVIKRCVL